MPRRRSGPFGRVARDGGSPRTAADPNDRPTPDTVTSPNGEAAGDGRPPAARVATPAAGGPPERPAGSGGGARRPSAAPPVNPVNPPNSANPVTAANPAPDGAHRAALPARLVRRLVAGLPSGLLVLDAADVVVLANPAARALGVVVHDEIDSPALQAIVARARAAGGEADTTFDLPPRAEAPLTRPRPDQEATALRVHVMPLGGDGHLAVVLDDVTEHRRVEKVRRDFVANVSHELKTPVGALHVLAEAVAAASDDPVAVRRFASRMTHESSRLARLVQEIIDLSRLQGADPLPDPAPVSVAGVLAESLDRTRLAAQTREIAVAVIGTAELEVLGDEGQLATAVANLIDNAITYSPKGTRVVVGVRLVEQTVEISVADEGIGIAEKDLERVFERFYRADPARSRATGGTGLGLAIVKHVATNHGGTVGVWSKEGSGSTFTVRLPVHAPAGVPAAPGAAATTNPDAVPPNAVPPNAVPPNAVPPNAVPPNLATPNVEEEGA